MYDEQIAGPMRAELTQLGFEETRTPQEVDAVLQEKKGTVLDRGSDRKRRYGATSASRSLRFPGRWRCELPT